MGDYESVLNEPGPFHRRVNMDSYLRSYIYGPAFYLLSVARATQMVEAHCHPEDPPKVRLTHVHQERLLGAGNLPVPLTPLTIRHVKYTPRHHGKTSPRWLSYVFIF